MTRVRGCSRSKVGTRVEPLQTALQQFTQLWVNRVFLLSDRRKPGHRILRKVELTGCGDRDRALNTWFRWFIAGTQPHLVR